jgi:hypothetical protein
MRIITGHTEYLRAASNCNAYFAHPNAEWSISDQLHTQNNYPWEKSEFTV